MSVVRRIVLVLCLAVVLAEAGVPGCGAQTAGQAGLDQAAAENAAAQPAEAYRLPAAKLAKAVALNRIRSILDIVGGLWGVVAVWLLLASRLGARLEAWVCRAVRRRWAQGLVYFAMVILLLTLADLPLDIYGHSVSLGYGISVQGWASWAADLAKALGLSIAVGAPLMLLFHWIVRRWPRHYWLGCWLVTLPLMVAGVFAAPLLEPLFNQYEPLWQHYAPLVARLEEVAARTGTEIPPGRMFLMKASEKSNGLNAYVNGLGATKRIVVWDTTAGRIPEDQVMFIFGHECGHYVLRHIPKMLAGVAIALFFVYWACAGIAAWLGARFGGRWTLTEDGLRGSTSDVATACARPAPLATRAGFVMLVLVISAAGFLLEPVSNTFSRHFEHEADVYGQEAMHGLVADPRQTAVAAFNSLGEAWLEDPDPSPLVEFWEYSHPSVKSRAEFAEHYDPWANGGHGEFFAK